MPTVGPPRASAQHRSTTAPSWTARGGLQGLSGRGDEDPHLHAPHTLLDKTLHRVTHQWAVGSRPPNPGDED